MCDLGYNMQQKLAFMQSGIKSHTFFVGSDPMEAKNLFTMGYVSWINYNYNYS
jgi:hypothetical protein